MCVTNRKKTAIITDLAAVRSTIFREMAQLTYNGNQFVILNNGREKREKNTEYGVCVCVCARLVYQRALSAGI